MGTKTKRVLSILGAALLSTAVFAQSNANDTQAAIVNSLLIQQLMQMQQQQGQQQQNQQPPVQQQTQVQQQVTEAEKPKKKEIETEDDLLDAGYKRFKISEDAEDNIVIKAKDNNDYEVEIWAVNNRNRLRYYGTLLVKGKKGYKGNPLDDDLDSYKAVWLKITNDDEAIIRNVGEKFSDQHFEIQQ